MGKNEYPGSWCDSLYHCEHHNEFVDDDVSNVYAVEEGGRRG